MLKEEILSLVDMQNVVDKLGIKIRNNMCSCPFHKDDTPSMKIYEKSFYCFSCNKTGDLIQFVQYYYDISFKEAMKTINDMFGLNLTNQKPSYKKINAIKKEKEKKQKEKEELLQEFISLCNKRILYINLYKNLMQDITKLDSLEKETIKSFFHQKIEVIDLNLDDLERKL